MVSTRRSGGCRRLRAALAAALLALAVALAPPLARAAGEYELKSAFLYNFAKYVEWPADAFEATEGVLVVGLLVEAGARDRVADELADRRLDERRVGVRRVTGADDVVPCQVLFVGASEEARWPGIAREIAGQPILTVGESSDFLRRGGMISFAMEGEKLRFEINRGAVERAGLQMSSQLLKLARRVIGGTRNDMAGAAR